MKIGSQKSITFLPFGIEPEYFDEERPTPTAKQHDEVMAKWAEIVAKAAATGEQPTNGAMMGGSVHLDLEQNVLRLGNFIGKWADKFAKGLLPRWNSPSWTKIELVGDWNAFEGTKIVDKSNGARNCLLFGLNESGVNNNQLIACTGGSRNPRITRWEDNFRSRQRNEYGLDIADGSYQLKWLVEDGDMRHVMPVISYGKRSPQWLAEQVARSTDFFSKIVVVADDVESIRAVCAEYAVQGYIPWKWIVPLAERDHGVVA